MDCVHSLVWYVEETYVVASYKADILLSTASYLLHTNVLESVHVILTSLLEGGGVCVCSNMFIFFENLNVKSLIFCCKNMSTPHSFVSFRNLSILSSICLPLPPFFPFFIHVFIYTWIFQSSVLWVYTRSSCLPCSKV